MHLPMRLAFSMWPGTLAAWRHGDVRSLLIAILFGAILSTAWVGTMIWPLWFSSWRLGLLWSVVTVGVVASVIHNAAQGLLRAKRPVAGCPTSVLAEAQGMYLKASYFEAEQAIGPYCVGRDMDVEAALLLAAIYRRTERFPQAIAMLERLSRLERAGFWIDEIEREKRRALQQKIRSHSSSL